jgi:Zn-dependent protease
MNWTECKDRCKRFLWFSRKEMRDVLILIFLFAFIFSFDQWGAEIFDFNVGLRNLFIAFVVVAIIVLVHHFSQRFVCILFFFNPLHRIWWFVLFLSLYFVFISKGLALIFFGSVFSIKMSNIHRLGWQRYGLNLKQQGLIAISGNIIVILFVALVKLLPQSVFLDSIVLFGVLFAFFNMLPIPPLDGGLMLLGSRLYFVFLFGALVGFLLFFSAGFLTALFLGMLIGIISWAVFYWFFEKTWG